MYVISTNTFAPEMVLNGVGILRPFRGLSISRVTKSWSVLLDLDVSHTVTVFRYYALVVWDSFNYFPNNDL